MGASEKGGRREAQPVLGVAAVRLVRAERLVLAEAPHDLPEVVRPVRMLGVADLREAVRPVRMLEAVVPREAVQPVRMLGPVVLGPARLDRRSIVLRRARPRGSVHLRSAHDREPEADRELETDRAPETDRASRRGPVAAIVPAEAPRSGILEHKLVRAVIGRVQAVAPVRATAPVPAVRRERAFGPPAVIVPAAAGPVQGIDLAAVDQVSVIVPVVTDQV